MLAISKNKAINLKTRNIHKGVIYDTLSNAKPFWSKAKIINYLYLMNEDPKIRRAIDDYAEDNNLIRHDIIKQQKADLQEQINLVKQTLFKEIPQVKQTEELYNEFTIGNKLYSFFGKFRKYYKGLTGLNKMFFLFMTLRSYLHKYNKLYTTALKNNDASNLSIKEKFNFLEKEFNREVDKLRKIVVEPNDYSPEKEKAFIRNNNLSYKTQIDINNRSVIIKRLSEINQLDIPIIYLDGYNIKYYMADLVLEYFKIKIFLHNVFLHEIPALLYYKTFKSKMGKNGCWLIAMRTLFVNITGKLFGLHNPGVKKRAKRMLRSEKLFKYIMRKFNRKTKKTGANNFVYKHIFPRIGFVRVNKQIKNKTLKNTSFKSDRDFNEKNITKIIKELGPIYLSTYLKVYSAGHAYVIYGAYEGMVYFTDFFEAGGKIRSEKIESFIDNMRIRYKRAFVHKSYLKSTSRIIDTSFLEELRKF